MNTRTVLALALLCQLLAFTPGARGQVYEKVFDFTEARDGAVPYASLVKGRDNNFYGTTVGGGMNSLGTVFRITPGGVLTTLVEFTGNGASNKGERPEGGLVEGSDGNFYGTTELGGASGFGTVFRMTPGGVLTTLVQFTGNTGSSLGRFPHGKLVQGSDGNFYGTTYGGGAPDDGTVFRVTPSGVLTTLVQFTGNQTSNKGERPEAGLVQGSDGDFYGTTSEGGANDLGTVFRMTPAGELSTLVQFTGNGASNRGSGPVADLLQGSDGNFYGTTTGGGASFAGTVFRMTPVGVLTTLVEFSDDGAINKGGGPRGTLVQGSDGNFYGTTQAGGASGFGTVFRMTPAGALTTLVEFTNNGAVNKGRIVRGGLVQGFDGNYYGTTSAGGALTFGTVFRMTPAGVLTTLVEFNGNSAFSSKARFPEAALAQGSDGNFYGTTSEGGPANLGTVFRVTPAGVFTKLVDFTGIEGTHKGSNPRGDLLRGSDGNLYGTTREGGVNDFGTIFRMTPAGVLTTLVEMGSAGFFPAAGLVEGSDGNFYGTAQAGGANGFGTVFRMTPAGTVTRLVSFSGVGGSNKGSSPSAGLLEGSDGNFYGTTSQGGGNDLGTVFRMTPAGVLTTLVEFTGNEGSNKGRNPRGLMEGSDGDFYGTTTGGGIDNGFGGHGTVFKMTPAGVLTTLVEFTGNGASNKGEYPIGGLAQGSDGNFYGTTSQGGSNDFGTIFRMTPTGVLTTLVDIEAQSDAKPTATLIRAMALDGNLYGSTAGLPIGNNSAGTIYRLIFPGAPLIDALNVAADRTGALVTAEVNARGAITTVQVEYGSDGISFPNIVPVTVNLAGYQNVLLGTTLAGLNSGASYFCRVRATSSGGERVSHVQGFSTLAEPAVATAPASDVAPTSARFNGIVNARNFDTIAVFEWGTDGISFPNTEAATPGMATGSNDTDVSAAVAGLPEGSTVFYRLRATSAGGTAVSGARGFSTGLGVTTTALGDADVGVSDVLFKATVNTFGQTVAVKFKYWADSAPGVVFETATQTVTSNGPVEVSARVVGLLENVSYSYRVSVELAGTETDGGAVGFTTDTNEAPMAVNDLVFYSGQVVVDPLANDSDPNDGSNVNLLLDPALVVAPDASRGVASVTNDRRGISYNPQFNVLDDDSLTYRVLDPLGASADGQVRLIAFSKRAGLYGGKILFGSGASAREGQVAVQMGGGGAISTSFMAWPSEGAGERESFVLKGVFDQRGRFTRTLNSPAGAVLTITLALDADAPRMLGTFEERVNEVSTTGEIAFVLTKDANTGGLAESGLRTGFLSPPSAQAGVMADGYLRMTVGKDARRGARFAGRLPDGEPFLTGARAQGRTYSLSRALEQGGVFTGLVRAIDTSAGAGGMMGNLLWQKRASSRARYERGGVSSVLSLSGVAYPALERGALPPLGANVRLILGGVRRSDGSAVSYRDLLMQLVPGSMAAQIVGSDPMQATGEDIPLTKLQVKVDAVNAAFRGRFLHPATGRTVPFDGALRMPFDGEPVQGRGVFRGPSAAGSVRIEAN